MIDYEKMSKEVDTRIREMEDLSSMNDNLHYELIQLRIILQALYEIQS